MNTLREHVGALLICVIIRRVYNDLKKLTATEKREMVLLLYKFKTLFYRFETVSHGNNAYLDYKRIIATIIWILLVCKCCTTIAIVFKLRPQYFFISAAKLIIK